VGGFLVWGVVSGVGWVCVGWGGFMVVGAGGGGVGGGCAVVLLTTLVPPCPYPYMGSYSIQHKQKSSGLKNPPSFPLTSP